MRKLFFTFLSMLVASLFVNVNADDVFLAGFEDGETGYTLNKESYSQYTQSFEANPEKTGINNSDKCMIATSTAVTDRWGYWFNITLDNPVTITSATRYLKVMVKRSPNNTNMALHLKHGSPWGRNVYAGIEKPSKTGVWCDLVFDLFYPAKPELSSENKPFYDFLICFGTWEAGGIEPGVCMLDNVVLSDNPKPRGAYEVPAGLLVNFEDEVKTTTNFEKFDVQSESASTSIVSNPAQTGVNPSAKCLMYNKPESTIWWHSLLCTVNGIIPVEYPQSYLHVMMHIPDASPTTILINSLGKSITEKVYPPDGEEWYDYVVDVSELLYITQINFRFNSGEEADWANPAASYYVDDFVLDNNPDPREKVNSGILGIKTENVKKIVQNGQLQLISDDMKAVSVYGVTGQLINRQTVAGSSTSVNLSAGMYFIQIENKSGELSAFKFVMK